MSETAGGEDVESGRQHGTAVVSPEPSAGNRSQDFESQELQAKEVNKEPLLKFYQLLTFIRRAIIYLTLKVVGDLGLLNFPLWAQAIFKCLPIVSLMVFVFRQYDSFRLLAKHTFGLLVFIGLFFSLIGDACLVFDEGNEAAFLAGMISFMVAQIIYVFSFGWKPLKTRLLFRSLIAFGLLYYYAYIPNTTGTKVSVGGRSVLLKVGVAIYLLSILGMQWRAWARVTYYDLKNGRWYEVLGAFGSSTFFVSDLILAINIFKFHVPGAHYAVMVTYYLAQMLISLSVVEGESVSWPQEREQLAENKECCCNPKDWLTKGPRCVLNWIFQ